MADPTTSIQGHYGSDNLVDRILGALAASGHDVAHPTTEMLHLVDQLHTGGMNSTKAQAEMVGITGAMRVLDAGCGIGGGSRFLVQNYGCQVDAIDLTPQYVEAAARLNSLCGLDDKITVRAGSVTNLPYPDQSFDVVWSQNVTMNVADKRGMFAEAYRVLKPGGWFTFTHAAQGPAGEPYYPLPWARNPSYSFLGTPEEISETLQQVGFSIVKSLLEGSTPGNLTQRKAEELGPATAMGADMDQRQANGARSRKDGRLIFMLVLARRPS